ncbi:MAG: hypothetical protein LBQ01_01185, partial [Prevotellaceae bacterium]|nr:hypothetical protein [Prevotellaceae bacterium]
QCHQFKKKVAVHCIPLGMHRSVEKVPDPALHSVRNASTSIYIYFIPRAGQFCETGDCGSSPVKPAMTTGLYVVIAGLTRNPISQNCTVHSIIALIFGCIPNGMQAVLASISTERCIPNGMLFVAAFCGLN